jgi:glycerophosphoryl diester phosphodiesterase
MLAVLAEYGYRAPSDPVFLQCFDAAEVERLRNDLGTRLRLIQLVGDNEWLESATDYTALLADEGLAAVAEHADGIGPWLNQLYTYGPGGPSSTGVVERAHELGLDVHPYTFRLDSLPEGFETFEGLIGFVIGELGADGIFTDFPDAARRAIDALQA